MRVYGFHPVREALRSRAHEVRRVLIGSRRSGGRLAEIEQLAARAGVAVERVPDERLDPVGEAVHNGFVAELATAAPAGAGSAGDPQLVVLAEDIQDPRNLGALLRVCEGAGVGRVLLRHRGSAPITATVVKTSAGAAQWLPVERVPNTVRAMEELQAEGFWVYGADAEGSPPWTLDLTGPIVFCVGGEEKGLRRLTRERCDGLVGLPMRGRVESLNLATATAAILYEAVRQRQAAESGRPLAPIRPTR